MNQTTRKIPAHALKSALGDFELGDNGSGAKSAPIKLVALGGDIIEHSYFGNIIHDLSGMSNPSRIAIDYLHDERDIIGYINHFSSDGQLVLSGALVPFKDSDRATEVLYKLSQGVPYQASIDYTPTKPNELILEDIPEGFETTVNGKTLSGPLLVIRKWTLGGVAICPRGRDSDTQAYLQSKNNNEELEVTVMTLEKQEEVEKNLEEVVETEESEATVECEDTEADAEAVETEDTDVETTETADVVESKEEKTDDAETDNEQEPETKLSLTRDDYLQMVERFGSEKAGDYFGEGLSMDEAFAKFHQSIMDENSRMKEELAKSGHVGFSAQKSGGATNEQFTVSVDAIHKYCARHKVDFDEAKKLFLK